uniref:LIM zinc-binding domain-containing protein n=1 Tax=Kalanchoe fedtschenkoi TaxID=63787 RepID=A0A7N0TXY6_KALFE
MAGVYGGTTQKCRACDKTVYLVDQLTADNRVYHRACFRCHHCNNTLKLFNYNSFEGVLYCKPHYDQLFKLTGSLSKSFEAAPRVSRTEKDQAYTNTRFSSMFGGTQDKCVACKKTVYPIEKVGVDGSSYHKACFRCGHGGCVISPSNYVAHEQRIYCRHHHTQLFKQKGNFSQLGKRENDDGKVTQNGKITENGKAAGIENGAIAA